MPHIKMQKLQNCRDLSHFVTKDGRKIKNNTLIRSETLFKATEKDIKKLTDEYFLKTVIDFRTEIECEQKPDPEINGVENIHNPILRAETMGITREKVDYRDMPKIFEDVTVPPLEYMQSLYRNLVLDPHAREHYREFFNILLEKEGAFLWHCTAGKDRVGVGTALLLSALGVDREEIILDYLMTDFYYKRENAKLKFLIKVAVKDKKVKTYLRYLLCVRREYICAAFDAIDEKYGDIETYLRDEMGLDYEKMNKLRNKLLD